MPCKLMGVLVLAAGSGDFGFRADLGFSKQRALDILGVADRLYGCPSRIL